MVLFLIVGRGSMEPLLFKQKLLINFSLCFSAMYLKCYISKYILDLNNKINKLLKKLSKYNII